MGALKLKHQAEVTRLPAHDLLAALQAMIEATVARQLELRDAHSAAGPAPTLRGYRARSGHSLAELAQLAGISKSYLSNLERCAVQHPNFAMLDRLARALNLETSTFRQAIIAEIERKRREM